MTQATDHSGWIYARGPYDSRPEYRIVHEMHDGWENVTYEVAQATQEDVGKGLDLDKWYIFVIPCNPVEGDNDIQAIFRHIM